MNATIARIALTPLIALVAACAVAPQAPAEEEREGSASSAITVPMPPPGVLTLTPMSLCSSTTADHSTGYPASPGYLVTGTSNASATCDYYVTEVTGVYAQNIVLAVTADPFLVNSASDCAASTETFSTFGWIPAKYLWVGAGQIEYVPGYWKQIAQQTINGVYIGPAYGPNPSCAFNPWIPMASATGTASAEITDSPYSVIRVATQANYYVNGVASRGPVGTYVVPK
jgi:hypothetical protein